jgi:hypothetical protein
MRYTAVFEFADGNHPAVGAKDKWLGGDLCACQFSDALHENEMLRDMLEVVLGGLENGNVKSQPMMRPITPDATSVGMCSLAELIRETLTHNVQGERRGAFAASGLGAELGDTGER